MGNFQALLSIWICWKTQMGKAWGKAREYNDEWGKRQRYSKQSIHTYLDFPEQIISCHARHTVVCYNKIHIYFLQIQREKKNLKPRKENTKKSLDFQTIKERNLPVDCLRKLKVSLDCFGHPHKNPETLEPYYQNQLL